MNKYEKNQIKGLVIGIFMLFMYVGMFIGGTYAWFSDSFTTSGNTIQSGTLDMELYLVGTTTHEYNHTTGALDDTSDYTLSTLLETGSSPIISLDNAQPGDTGTRLLKIVNNGTVAFTNTFELTVTDSSTLDEYITIKGYESDVNGVKGDEMTAVDGKYDLGISTTSADSEIYFMIEYSFDKTAGNAAQDLTADYTFTLTCDQLGKI